MTFCSFRSSLLLFFLSSIRISRSYSSGMLFAFTSIASGLVSTSIVFKLVYMNINEKKNGRLVRNLGSRCRLSVDNRYHS